MRGREGAAKGTLKAAVAKPEGRGGGKGGTFPLETDPRSIGWGMAGRIAEGGGGKERALTRCVC